ncbi:MAG: hypothetical protein IPH11_10685 [Ignavibacteriales bacterium]|nr:hypothetical protein [Ignavibacteriales bacterium]
MTPQEGGAAQGLAGHSTQWNDVLLHIGIIELNYLWLCHNRTEEGKSRTLTRPSSRIRDLRL